MGGPGSRGPDPARGTRSPRLRRLTLAAAVALAALAGAGVLGGPPPAVVPVPGPTPTPSAPVEGVYGSGIGMDSLNNTVVGGPAAQEASYRFRAATSGMLASVRVYVIGPAHEGYGAGTGGVWEVTVRPDDGTPRHEPAATAIARARVAPADGFPVIAFSPRPSLVQGGLYHVVFRNADPDPASNYVSLDGIFMYQPTSPRQPLFSDTDWGESVSQGGRPWSDLESTVPIMQIDYADGTAQGLGYMEVWVRSPKTVSGAARVREAFTVSGPPRRVSSLAVRLMRISGEAPLSVSLATADGAPVAEGAVPAAAIPIGRPGNHDGPGHATWVTLDLGTPRVLDPGTPYTLTLAAPADTAYSVFVIRKGIEHGFSPLTYFADGRAQATDGGDWGPFTQDGGGPLDEGDLQFYFR